MRSPKKPPKKVSVPRANPLGARRSGIKGSKQGMLPSRAARVQLTDGDHSQRSMNNYAKLTPGLGDPSPSIMDFGAKKFV